jgi:cell wall-associated NlpC family hydrolase
MAHSLDPRLHAYNDDVADIRLKGMVNRPRYEAGQLYQVTSPISELRGQFDDKALKGKQESQMLFGETVTVFAIKNNIAFVQSTHDNYVGYISRLHLSPYVKKNTHRVSVRTAQVYADATMKSTIIMALPMNAEIFVTGEAQNGYLPIAWNGDHRGFISEKHLKPSSQSEGDIVKTAESLLGTPYVWGGTSTFGIDCSGLLQTAFKAAGRACPRDTDMQEADPKLGYKISITDDIAPKNLKRGDIIFFKGHVGIMTDHKHLIHANANFMRVTIDPLADVAARIKKTEGIGITSVVRYEQTENPEKQNAKGRFLTFLKKTFG